MEISERTLAVYREACRAAAPPPDIGITAWSEQYRVLGHRSRLAGPYRAIRTPYWREPMDALSPDSGVQTVVVMKGAQLGASEFLLNVLDSTWIWRRARFWPSSRPSRWRGGSAASA